MTSVPVTIQERIPMPVNVAARPAGPAGGMNVGDVIRILKQRIFLIMFLWIFMTASAAGISFYLQAKHPLFTARSAIYVESPIPKNPLQLTERTVQVELMDRFVADQAVLLKDDQILAETLQAARVLETAWYRAQPDKDELLIELKDDLFVRQVSNTNYLAVSFATRDREDAPVIVNTVIEKYLTKVQQASFAQYQEELDDADTEEKRLVNELEDVRAQKRRFLSEELGSAGATEGLNVVGETWRTLAAEVTRLEAEKLQNQAAYENLVGVDPSQIVISPQMTLMIEQDTQVAGLKNQELALNQEIATALQRLGQNHRAVQDLKAKLLVVDETLQKIMAQKENEIREYQVNVAHTSFLNAMQAELQLRERMLEAEDKQRDLDQALIRYRQLEEDQLLLEHQLTQIREHMNLLKMIIKDRGMVRVRQIGQALPPKLRSFPNHLLNIPAGSILGLLLGIGLAFLLEFIDTSVKTSQDIVRHVHIPLLGTVPDLDDEELAIKQMELAAHTAPHSMIAEAFRAIRANLQLSAPAEKQKTVLITSA
ncbi:MAG: hypothetical protein JSV03_07770, partial [Planctomycetota bacterium]